MSDANLQNDLPSNCHRNSSSSALKWIEIIEINRNLMDLMKSNEVGCCKTLSWTWRGTPDISLLLKSNEPVEIY